MQQKKKEKALLVVKVGSAILLKGHHSKQISKTSIQAIAQQINELKKQHHVVLVSSGAIVTARQFINMNKWNNQIASKQAMSAIGQPKLIQTYHEALNEYNISIAQCLMTYRDFESSDSRKNTLNTIWELLLHDYVPIVNENDTVGVEEIMLGDNDQLSAKVAILLKAKLLILASDVNGVYNKNPKLHEDAILVENINLATMDNCTYEEKGNIGTGGMRSKLKAAKDCALAGIETLIVNGKHPRFATAALRKEIPHTHFSISKYLTSSNKNSIL